MAVTAHNLPETPQAGVLTIGELGRTIRRNGIVFWSTLILGLLIGAALTYFSTKSYVVWTDVLVDGPNGNGQVTSIDNNLAEIQAPGASYSLDTQIELLQSQEIFFRVLDQANIPRPRSTRDLEKLPQVTISQVNKSNVFRVIVEGPVKSDEDTLRLGTVGSLYPVVFRDYLNQLKSETVRRGVDFVNSRLEEERNNLKTAETELANYKVRNTVVDSQAELGRQINETAQTQEKLIAAQIRYNEATVAVQRLEEAFRSLPKTKDIETVSTDNQSLLQQREKLGDLETQRSILAETFREDAPQMKEIDGAIAQRKQLISDMEKSLKTTITTTNPRIDEMEKQLIEARAGRDAAQASLAEVRSLSDEKRNRLNQLAEIGKDQRELERKVVQHQELISGLTAVLQRFELRDNSLRSNIVNLTPTNFPQQTRPNVLVNMALATLLSLALAFVFALSRDSMQDKVNSIDEAYALSKLDVMTRIPERPRGRSALISDPQTSLAFESYRVLRSLIGFMSNESPIKSLVVTSTGKGEGKTVISSNLAVAFALNGQKVILVDGNFRSPQIHAMFGKSEKPGLGEILLQQETVETVLLETPVPGLQIIPCGTVPANATEALGSVRMKALIDELERRADIVIFDTPSTLGLADTPSLATHADASIMVMHAGKPGKAEFSDAVGLLKAASPRVLGLVMNRVKAKNARLENA